MTTGLLPEESKLNYIEKNIPTKRKGRILGVYGFWRDCAQVQMFLVNPPPTWKATGVRGKNRVVWPIAGSLILLECKHTVKWGRRERKGGSSLQQLLLMEMDDGPHPLLHGFKSGIPREHIWGCNGKTSFETNCMRHPSSLMPSERVGFHCVWVFDMQLCKEY